MENKRKKYLTYSALVFSGLILFLILFDKVLMPWYVHADELRVPNVIGKNKDEAMSILKGCNLDPVLASPKNDTSVPEGQVLFQKPRPGADVKEGRRVYIYYSGGLPSVKIPNLYGKTLRDAKVTLERFGLNVGNVTQAESDMPQGVVISQSYSENSNLNKGTVVDLVLSRGRVVGNPVPGVVGLSLQEARAQLQAAGFTNIKITYQPVEKWLPNTVIDQSPQSGEVVKSGGSISLFVTSQAKEPVESPTD